MRDVSLPSVFVGSSQEAIEIARAIQVQLSDSCAVELWNEGVFRLGFGTLESLVQALSRFDFGIIILTADDLTLSRGIQQRSARDDLYIEVGLFVGRLGRERTFLICCQDDEVKIPSDLAGMVFATFSMPADPNQLISSVGPPCVKIRNAVRTLGKVSQLKKITEDLETQDERMRDQERRVTAQQELLNNVVKYSMSATIFDHLCGIALLKEYLYRDGATNRREMYYLRDHGFIMPKSKSGFLDFDGSVDGRNLVDFAEPTPIGWYCLRLRKNEISRHFVENRANLNRGPSDL